MSPFYIEYCHNFFTFWLNKLLRIFLFVYIKKEQQKTEGKGMTAIEVLVTSFSALMLMLVIYQFGQMFN